MIPFYLNHILKPEAFHLSVQSVTKERGLKLMAQHKDTAQLAQQIHHVLNFCNWAITNGSSTALLYSKRLVSLIRTTKHKPDVTEVSLSVLLLWE